MLGLYRHGAELHPSSQKLLHLSNLIDRAWTTPVEVDIVLARAGLDLVLGIAIGIVEACSRVWLTTDNRTSGVAGSNSQATDVERILTNVFIDIVVDDLQARLAMKKQSTWLE